MICVCLTEKEKSSKKVSGNRADRKPAGIAKEFRDGAEPRLNLNLADQGREKAESAAGKGAADQRIGIILGTILALAADQLFIAGIFHIMIEIIEGDPKQRLEPINAKQQIGQRLDPMIQTLDMGAGMADGKLRIRLA